MIYPLTYPRHPGRFAAALFLALAAVFAGYSLTVAFRRPIAPQPPQPGPGGLELVPVASMTSPQASRAFSPRWQPDVHPPQVDTPEAPPIPSDITPSPAELRAWAVYSQQGEASNAAPDVRVALADVRTAHPQVIKWTLLPSGATPPKTEITRPEVTRTLHTAAVPLPPVDDRLGPRLLPEMLNRGQPLPPSHPVATGPPLRP